MIYTLLSRKRQVEIEESIIEMFQDFGIKPTYPMSIQRTAEILGIKVVPYSSLSDEERVMAYAASSDAFHIRTSNFMDIRIIVDDTCGAYFYRSRFSGAHELGHIWLAHKEDQPNIEEEANYFAGYFLAPHPLILTSPANTNFAEAFGVSIDCASFAYNQANSRVNEGSWRPHEQWLLEKSTWIGGGLLSQM